MRRRRRRRIPRRCSHRPLTRRRARRASLTPPARTALSATAATTMRPASRRLRSGCVSSEQCRARSRGSGLLRGCFAAEAAHGHYGHRRGVRIGGDRNRRRLRLSRDVRRSRSSAPPPVIKADTAPSKIVPAPANKTPNKLITDRIGDHAEGEKLVSREEKPVEIQAAEIKTNPALATIPPPQANAQHGAAQPAPGGAVIVHRAEEGSHHRHPSRSDGRWSAGSRCGRGAAPPLAPAAAPAPAPPDRHRSRKPPQPAATIRRRRRTACARAARCRAGATRRGASRQCAAIAEPRCAAATRTMRTAAVAAPPPPAAQATHTAGGYAVQVSSQRSEADAQAAFRWLAGQIPEDLGRPPSLNS